MTSLSALASTNAPMFLKKAFTMITTCDPSIASWSDDGLSFVVYDKERFASVVIPEYFKHSNFSSFVRQLNFYGYRKVRSDPIRLRDSALVEETRFYHEHFQRNRPDLLSEIKKPSQVESADKQEVEKLKVEVDDLKRDLDAASDDVERLTMLVNSMNQGSMNISTQTVYMNQPPPPMVSDAVMYATPVPSHAVAVSADEMEPYPLAVVQQQQAPVSAPVHVTSDGDESALRTFFPATMTDSITLLEGPAQSTNPSQTGQMSTVDPRLVERLHNALLTLPEETQTLLVERIVDNVIEPTSFQAQVDAMTALAASAANVASLNRHERSYQTKDQHDIHLASSILGAYIESIKKRHQAV